MLNDKKIEEIRKNIQTSALLTDHEKSDWLNLLELMNDKQLNELEEILASNGVEVAPAQPSMASMAMPPVHTSPPAQKMPPLSHIANIPTNVSMGQTPEAEGVKTSAKAPVKSPPPVRPTMPPVQPKPFTPNVPKAGVTQLKYKAESSEDVKEFSLETLRTYDLQSIVDAVRGLIQEHGYFKIVQCLEASPLYDSYINSGKERLRTTTTKPVSNNSLLTQEELEFMTDLLRHMRFNRW